MYLQIIFNLKSIYGNLNNFSKLDNLYLVKKYLLTLTCFLSKATESTRRTICRCLTAFLLSISHSLFCVSVECLINMLLAAAMQKPVLCFWQSSSCAVFSCFKKSTLILFPPYFLKPASPTFRTEISNQLVLTFQLDQIIPDFSF